MFFTLWSSQFNLHHRHHRFYLLLIPIISNYWTRVSKISWFVSDEQLQIIDLRDIDKSWYFAITEFNNCFIIRSPSLCFRNIFGKRSDLPFSRKSAPSRRKAWFRLRMSRIVFAAKNSWTTLRMSTPLFVGSYLQVTWWAHAQCRSNAFGCKYYSAHA